jgi:hypothetical protein
LKFIVTHGLHPTATIIPCNSLFDVSSKDLKLYLQEGTTARFQISNLLMLHFAESFFRQFMPVVAYLGPEPPGPVNRPSYDGEAAEDGSTTKLDIPSSSHFPADSAIELRKINQVTHSPLANGRESTGSISISEHPALLSEQTSVSSSPDTWLYHLQHNQNLYEFAIWTGILYPIKPTSQELEFSKTQHVNSLSPPAAHCYYTDTQLALRQYWVIFAHFMSLVFIGSCFAELVYIIASCLYNASINIEVAFEMLAYLIPVISIYPALWIFKDSIRFSLINVNKLSIRSSASFASHTTTLKAMKLLHINVNVYNSIIANAIKLSKTVLTILLIIPFLLGLVIFIAIFFATPTEGAVFSIVVFQYWSLIWPTAMLFGIVAFLVMDQRCSYYILLEMRTQALENELLDGIYFTIGKQLEKREQQSPLNVIVAMGLITLALVAGVLIYINIQYRSMSIGGRIASSISFVFVGLKEVITILLISYQMFIVNDSGDRLRSQVSLQLSTEIEDEKQRLRRVELLLLMNQYKIGSTIFFYRPSTTQLLLQSVSLGVGALTAIVKTIFNAVSG